MPPSLETGLTMLMLSLPISLLHHQSHKTQTSKHTDKAVEKFEQREAPAQNGHSGWH